MIVVVRRPPPGNSPWRWTSLGPNATVGDTQSTAGKGKSPSVKTDHRVVKQGQSWGSAGTNRVYASSTRVSNNSGEERPIGATNYRLQNTMASCHTTPPPPHTLWAQYPLSNVGLCGLCMICWSHIQISPPSNGQC